MLDMDERLRQVIVRGHLVVDAAEQARAVRALNSDILGQIDINSAENRGDAYRYLFVYLRLAQVNFKTAEDCEAMSAEQVAGRVLINAARADCCISGLALLRNGSAVVIDMLFELLCFDSAEYQPEADRDKRDSDSEMVHALCGYPLGVALDQQPHADRESRDIEQVKTRGYHAADSGDNNKHSPPAAQLANLPEAERRAEEYNSCGNDRYSEKHLTQILSHFRLPPHCSERRTAPALQQVCCHHSVH